jgi:kinesin family protein 2/24
MNLINEVDKPGSDIENYVINLDKVLLEKMKNIDQIRQRLKKFRIMLKDEEAISANFINSNDFIDSYEKNEKKNSYDLLKDEIEKDNFSRK